MSWDKYLRLRSNAEFEIKTSALHVYQATPVQFSSQITENSRKKIFALNNSNNSSGEVCWGGSDVTVASGIPLQKVVFTELPLSSDIDPYFIGKSGEHFDIRLLEIA